MLYRRNTTTLKDKWFEILELYPNGINDLLSEKGPKPDQPYIILILNCDKHFYSKYISFANRNCNSSEFQSLSISEPIPKSIPTVDEIYSYINETNKFLILIRQMLSEIAKSDEKLIDNFLWGYSKCKSEKMQKDHKEYYDECLKIFNHYKRNTRSIIEKKFPSFKVSKHNNEDSDDDDDYDLLNSNIKRYEIGEYDFYTEFSYEDYIIILCSFIKYHTQLKIKFELSNEQTFLLLYGDEKTYERIANKYRYDLQLKNYAYKYECDKIKNPQFKQSMSLKSKPISLNEDGITIISDTNIDNVLNSSKDSSNIYTEKLMSNYFSNLRFPNLQFHKLQLNNQLHFPPYFPFRLDKRDKFRTYEKNDNYHDCNNDPDFNNMFKFNCSHDCSIFRNIDKLRLINIALEKILKFSILSKIGLLDKVIYKQNYTAYEEKLSVSFLFKNNTQIYSKVNIMLLTNTIRNYYGEYLAFYFLWVAFFCKWILFPAVIGALLFLIKVFEPESLQWNIDTINHFKLNYYEIILIVFAVVITIWASSYLKAWRQREKLFSYIWGMENYRKKAPTNVNFKPNKSINFLFNEKIYTSSSSSFLYRRAISFIVLAIMVYLRVSFMLFIMKLHSTGKQTFQRSAMIYSFSGTVSKSVSMIYEYLARLFSQWENHEKYSQYENSLAFKLVMFEFFNNYSPLFYSAFYKPIVGEQCLYDDCFKEVELQLYTYLLINFSFNILEIGIPLFVLMFNKWKYQVTYHTHPHSEDHQLLRNKYNTLIYEYNERLISFGFVCLFSVVAPLTPLFVFILTFLENYVDLYKIIHLNRVELIEGSSGIEVFTSVFRLFYIVGMLTSIAIVLFTNPNIYKISYTLYDWERNLFANPDFISRFLVFALLENVIFLFGGIDFNTLPTWFTHLDEFKSIYKRKYYDRKQNELPHLTMEDNANENRNDI